MEEIWTNKDTVQGDMTKNDIKRQYGEECMQTRLI